MKTAALVLFFFAAYVSADNFFSKVMHARVRDKLVPLSATVYDEEAHLSFLSYGSRNAAPVEFGLLNNYLVTRHATSPGFGGFYDGLVGFGSIEPIEVQIDSKTLQLQGLFWSCQVKDHPLRAIVYGISLLPLEECFPVELFLSGGNDDSSLASSGSKVDHQAQGGEDDASEKEGSGPRMAFFAKVANQYIPLSSVPYEDDELRYSILSYGKGEEAVQFEVEDGHAVNKHSATPGAAVNFDGVLVYGQGYEIPPLEWDQQTGRLPGYHSSCKLRHSYDRVIGYAESSVGRTDCYEVEVYFLPLDFATSRSDS